MVKHDVVKYINKRMPYNVLYTGVDCLNNGNKDI